MKRFYLSKNELVRRCPCGSDILDYAYSQRVGSSEWDMLNVEQDAENSKLFHATFDLPNVPGSLLEFEYEIMPGQMKNLCRLITKRTGPSECNGSVL